MIQITFYIFLAFIVVKILISYIKNQSLPVVSTNATLIRKEREFQTHLHLNGTITNYEMLFLIFQLGSGNHVKFKVEETIYNSISVYEYGVLNYKGISFLQFSSTSMATEKRLN